MQVMTQATAALLKPIRLDPNDRILISVDKGFEHFVVDIHSEWHGRKGLASGRAKETLSRIPERKQVQSAIGLDTWQLAATDVTALVLNALWPAEKMHFYDEESEVTFKYLLATESSQRHAAETFAHYVEHRDQTLEAKKWPTAAACCHPYTSLIETLKHEVHPDPEKRLSLYQRVALHNAMKCEGYGEFMEQGTGKTPIVVARIMNECQKVFDKQKKPRMYRALILCPKGVRLNWEREITKFATQPGKVRVLRGLKLSRAKWIVEAMRREKDCKYSVLIMTYETLMQSWEMLQMIEWDLVAIDESQNIKDPKAKRTMHMLNLLRQRARRRMVLTGTPIANSPLDVYAQLEFLAKGGSGFMSWKNFRSFYGVYEVSEAGYEALVGMQNMPFMQERLTRMAFMCRKKEVMPELPPKTYGIEECEMGAEAWGVYKELATKLAAEIKDDVDSGKNRQLVVANALTKLLRLSQITSGYCMFDIDNPEEEERPLREQYDFESVPKLDRMVEMLQELPVDEKTIIWCNWKPALQRIHERLEEEGIKHVLYHGTLNDATREAAEYDFNHDPETRVFLGNPAAGGVGLNLLGYPPGRGDEFRTDCTNIYEYCKDWSMLKHSQGSDRAHRRGTRRPVHITTFCVPGTIDVEIHTRVEGKVNTALQLGDVREILNNLLSGLDSRDE